MRNSRLFTDQPLTPGDKVVLKGNVAQHLGHVLRARAGDRIALFNGDGQEFGAKVLTVRSARSALILAKPPHPRRSHRSTPRWACV